MMRLHTLTVTAFGPFVDAVHVDFDELSDAGLFLVTGATGAGKSSILDAVCFALYGDVPGDRSVARRLRSDQAPPHVSPRVTLEATLAGRRFRLVRSPAWRRPKKRGTGTTPQQASVTLTELVGDEWVLLSSRLDEVGDLVTGLLGMNLSQFCQVAMLPQGRFQAFLRARADERQAVLQQLFHTGRFARVEGWLRDHRLELHRRSRGLHDEVSAQVNRLSEAAGQDPPSTWDPQALETPAADGSLDEWARGLRQEVQARVADGASRLPVALAAEQESSLALEQATRTAELQQRRAAALAEQQALASDTTAHRARELELEAAQRAAGVVPLVRLAEQATWETSTARIREWAAWDNLRDALAPPFAQQLGQMGAVGGAVSDAVPEAGRVAELREAVRSRVDGLAGLRHCDARIRELTATTQETAEAVRQARERARERQDLVATLPAEVEHLRAAISTTTTEAEGAQGLEAELTALEARLEAHSRAHALTAELAEAEELRASSRSRAQDLTDTWLDIRETRLHGMAAEIAGALAVGGSCPVCGSCSHPDPARPSPGAPDAGAERSALRAVDDAKAVLHAHDQQVHDLRTRLEVARSQAGDLLPDEIAEQAEQCRAALRAAHEARARAEEQTVRLRDLETRLVAAHDRLRDDERDVSRLEERQRAVDLELSDLSRQRAVALAETGLDSVTALLSHLERIDGLAADLLVRSSRVEEAMARQHGLARSLASALAEHGFDSAEAARRAHRDEASLAPLRASIAQHVREQAHCEAVLADPELLRAAEEGPQDLVSLSSRHEELREAARRLRAEHEWASARAARLVRLSSDLEQTLALWRPLREELRVASDLAAFVEGKSVDNRLQMRLSAYVLGYRLSQVVAAANLRLATMSDGRFSLEHTGQRANRETRGGLTLLARDDWSGESRDPATLSGGETFIVSLALALGLADVITEEAGGADLDTLFVDEGFGSLDADTLDDVLDTLDTLRDRGRVVGVVSHVTEMRERIPTQLRVLKGRAGSTLTTVVQA